MVLNDVTEFVRNGASIKQEKGCKGTPITRIETISNSRFNYDRLGYADIFDDKYQDYYLQDNDVLLSHINSEKYLGRSVVYKQRTDENIIHGMNLLCLRFLKNCYNPSYFCYYSQSDIARMYISRNTKKSVNQASITATAIKNMPIPTTSIEEQKNVVYHLDSVQSIIDLNNEQMKKLDELIKSRFVEMFGDPILNQRGFPVYELGEVIHFQGGSQPEKKYFEYEPTENNIRLIQIRDYKSDNYITYIPKSMAKRFCTADDIMIGRYGPPIFQILKGIEGTFNVALMKATPKTGNKEFIRQFLKQDCLLEYLEGLSKRTAGQDGIQMDKLKSYPFPLPPKELQNAFADFASKVEQQKVTVQKSIDKLETLKKSLMQEYFG